MFPNHSSYNIIAYGGQEYGDDWECLNQIENYLGEEFQKVEMVGKGQIFIVVFVKKFDCLFLRQSAKNMIIKDPLGYGFKGGVMV